jgi:hypothetical protein
MSEPRGRRVAAADVAVWAVVQHSTRRLAARTSETLHAQRDVARLVDRYRRALRPHLAGRMFEIMQALSFNLAAADKASPLRARVTHWVGRPHAAADLEIVHRGRVVAEVQTKLMDSVSATAHDLARPWYHGMQGVVAGDRLEAVSQFLDKVIDSRDPDSLGFVEYVDTRAHLADSVSKGPVRSDPLLRAEVDRAADDPARWARGQVTGAASREVGAAVATGAVSGGLVSGLLTAAGEAARVRAGETSAAAAACTAAGAAARGAVRSGLLSGLGTTTRIAAAKGLLPAALGAGTVPAALAGAVEEVATAALAMARRQIGAGEFAARSCESTLQTALVWVCGTVGQTVIPVPVVGALVGGVVGQQSATVLVQGLQKAVELAREDGIEEERIALLEAEAAAAVETAVLLSKAERSLAEERNAYVATTIAPLLDDALLAAVSGEDDVVRRLGELVQSFAGQPLFATVDEFDRWMSDSASTLTLDPNAR